MSRRSLSAVHQDARARRAGILTTARRFPGALAGGLLAFGLLAVGGLLPGTALAQANPQEARARLDSLATDIQALQGKLADTRTARGDAQSDLKQVETAIGETHRRMDSLQAERRQLDDEVTALGERRESLRADREQQREALAHQMVALYRLGQTPQLKLLLNQDDPAQVDRLQHYLNALSEARQTRLAQLQTLDRQLDDNLAEIEQRRTRLDTVQADLDDQRERLAASLRERQSLVDSLDARFDSEQSRLEDLNQDRAHVERLLDRMQQALAKLDEPPPSTDIQQTRGGLPWPVQGAMLSRYGSGQGVNRNGILIGAPAGTAVKAVHAGRVVFANWMRGFGNLLIIDHGDGILTLYAHLQRIDVAAGERVANDATVGTVGDTGGQPRAALYFEVRQNGDPIDPGGWIARR
ncbi:murein hydrolase activator EnvC family protein [Salinicola avicenniae]|uniref:murein hydrolase activator EnvC family protein n=1 Tax=Salinicola avicenniae TaxID=2916836 RepID=UPI0020736B60|nr:peptidoglycan DD-metalloendopeptidase family protein [Salinicola sp. S1-1-8]